MKTLLLDNYDSFSHILFQYLWEINGEPPHFVPNDAMTLAEIRALAFDNIVISPGPGRPDVARDFGVCGQVIAAFPETPILGVCLGHQGLALAAGGRVVMAPAPRHGKVSRIHHDGQGLFAGVPQGFSAVRYHSLVVARESLPDEMEVTAKAEDDGQLMGLRHRQRPSYGVQFHPESIGTEWGRRILYNFKALTSAWQGRPGHETRRRESPTGHLPVIPRAGSAAARPARAMAARELPWRDPEAAFVRFFAAAPAAFWLDSQAAGVAAAAVATPAAITGAGPACAGRGPEPRHSYMGAGDWLCEARGGESRSFRVGPEGSAPGAPVPGDPFAFLEERLRQQETWKLPETCAFRGAFRGGWVGGFGYGLKAFAGAAPEPSHATAFPDAVFLEPERMLAFDHAAQKVFAFAPDSPAGRDWLAGVVAAWPALETAPPEDLRLERTGPDPLGLEGLQLPREFSAGREAYLASIRALQADIRAGESYEACLTNEISVSGSAASAPAAAPADPLRVYRILRRTNPAPYAAFFRLPQGCILSASPERFLKLDAAGLLTSRPIKGTRRRGATPGEDAALKAELAQSEKERSENLMIVDLMRNDFGRVCAPGSVRVPESMVVEEHPTVFQLVSEVEGRLDAGRTALEAVRACFPGGSMTGAPKLRTMELLAARERRARGIFSGAMGYLGADGAMDLGMVIRTLVWTPATDGPGAGRYTVGCGGAILAESDPDAEYAETLLKAMAPLRALELAAYGRGGGWKILP